MQIIHRDDRYFECNILREVLVLSDGALKAMSDFYWVCSIFEARLKLFPTFLAFSTSTSMGCYIRCLKIIEYVGNRIRSKQKRNIIWMGTPTLYIPHASNGVALLANCSLFPLCLSKKMFLCTANLSSACLIICQAHHLGVLQLQR